MRFLLVAAIFLGFILLVHWGGRFLVSRQHSDVPPSSYIPEVTLPTLLVIGVLALILTLGASVLAFNPDHGTANQWVRLPRETLADHTANCLDGAVLFANLLEAVSLSPALVIVPSHAFVGWQT